MYLHGETRPTFNSVQTINAISRIVSRAIQGGFNRQACLPVIQAMLDATPALANDTSFFYQDKFGRIYSDYDNPIIREDICVAQCGGSGMGWYTDSAARLVTWFIPGLFLISSLKLAAIGIQRFAMVSHLFGDPIHSYWSLLSKLEDWNECYMIALKYHEREQPPTERLLTEEPPTAYFWQFLLPHYAMPINKQARHTAVILAAIKELLPWDTDMGRHVAAIRTCSCSATDYNQIAGSIISARTSGTTTTWLAIGTYIFGIICAFIPALGGSGGSSGPSGGRIAPAMLLSWILPNILLNNEIGQLPREACIRAIRQLEEPGDHQKNCNAKSNPPVWTAKQGDDKWEELLDAQAWNGGIYSCQLEKPMLGSGSRQSIALVLIAVTSICISFSIAFGVLYSYPTFFSCRNILFLNITVVWLLSPFLTRLLMEPTLFNDAPRSKWRILVIKDSLVGFSIVFLLILSTCGLGNSCRCWAGFGNVITGVVLNPGKQFTQNNTFVYPILIAVCLGLQYVVFKSALFGGRLGLGVMCWSLEDLRESLPDRAKGKMDNDSGGKGNARGRADDDGGKRNARIGVVALGHRSEEGARFPGNGGFEFGRYGIGWSR